MAKHCLTDAYLSSNGVDLSDHLESVQYELGINSQAAAAMSELQDYDMPGTRTVSPIQATFYQDFAASEVWATHNALWTNRTTFSLIVKPTSGADSSTNPAFMIDVFIERMGAVTGSRGQRHMVGITYKPAGALTIDVT